MSASIKYKGEVIATINDNTEKVITTAGNYCEADIIVENTNDGVEINDGIIVTERNENGEAVAVDIYGEIIYTYMLGAGVQESYCWPYSAVRSFRLMSNVTEIRSSAFSYKNFSSMDFAVPESCTKITAMGGTFNSVYVPVGCNISGNFQRNAGTKKVTVLGSQDFGEYDYCFYQATGLEEVQLGSIGNPIHNIGGNLLFGYCTQAGLTVTVFASGANADLILRRIRSGATNATIIVKAAEDTVYNETPYSAGSTIITSTVEV